MDAQKITTVIKAYYHCDKPENQLVSIKERPDMEISDAYAFEAKILHVLSGSDTQVKKILYKELVYINKENLIVQDSERLIGLFPWEKPKDVFPHMMVHVKLDPEQFSMDNSSVLFHCDDFSFLEKSVPGIRDEIIRYIQSEYVNGPEIEKDLTRSFGTWYPRIKADAIKDSGFKSYVADRIVHAIEKDNSFERRFFEISITKDKKEGWLVTAYFPIELKKALELYNAGELYKNAERIGYRVREEPSHEGL